MDVTLILSLFYIIYGIAGILGFQVIPDRYRGHVWTKKYIRFRGISWLMLGIPALALDRAAVCAPFDVSKNLLCIIFLVLAIPAVVFSFHNERKYKSLLKNETGKQDRKNPHRKALLPCGFSYAVNNQKSNWIKNLKTYFSFDLQNRRKYFAAPFSLLTFSKKRV